jgi:hypothetical protein
VGRWAIFAAALLYCVLAVTGTVPYGDTPEGQIVMADGAAFYFLNEPPYDWTDRPPGVAEFRYSPAFLWVTAPLRLLPWAAFAAVWFSAHIVVLLYLRVPWMLAFPGVVDDVVRGNINLFIALVIVLVVRNRTTAALWATILLTKVTPGIGVIWHAGRREWRQLAIALGVTGGIVVVGVLADPELWAQWVQSLGAGVESYRTVDFLAPLPVRVLAGILICAVAALSGRAWVLPIGMLIALPGLWPSSFALLTASVVLYADRRLSASEIQDEHQEVVRQPVRADGEAGEA